MKIGIAISTYTQDNTNPERYNIIEKSLKSLSDYVKTTNMNLYIVIVVDGPIPLIHQQILSKYDFNVYHRSDNGGVARTKNTSIRLLLENGVAIGFLMDDDVEYKDGCLEQYVSAMLNTGLHHMSYCQMPEIVHPKHEWSKMGYLKSNINNYDVMTHGGGGVGCLLSFTPELIEKIGYFKVMSGKYGYEHINFSHRAIYHKMIPYVSDIVESHKYINHIGFEPVSYNKFKKNHSINEAYRVSENAKNKIEWRQNFNVIEPCIE